MSKPGKCSIEPVFKGRHPDSGPRAIRARVRGGIQRALWATLLSICPVHAAPVSGMVGKLAPTCELSAVGERPLPDMRALRGKVLYVDFWASWCVPCAQSFPFLNSLSRAYRDRGLEVIGINVDERADDALRFLRRFPANFLMGGDAGGACPKAYQVIAMPSSYLVDRSGRIRQVHIGFRNDDADRRRLEVEALLSEDAPFNGSQERQ